MRRFLLFAGLVVCFALAGSSFTQDRFDSGPNEGFTRSPTEQFIVEIERPFEVRSIRGVINDQAGNPMPDVTFEIRAESGRIREAKTDTMGRFKISGTAAGTYSFKATRNGFQSVVGKIVVAKKSDHKASIELTMPIGV